MSLADGRVWWLYGPPCVGKSATAWELSAHLLSGEARGYFDVDQVGMCYPERDDDPGRHALKARAAGALVRRFTAAGARTVVVSGVLDEGSLGDVVAAADGAAVTFCRLRLDPEVLAVRLRSRYGPADVVRALAEAQEWDRRDPDHVVVDTGQGSPLDVAHRVLEAARVAAPSVAPAASRPPSTPSTALAAVEDTEPGRAVLVCGPTAVGKSTIGFGLFGDLLGTGRASAYLDLQQLSFRANLAPGATSRHPLVADCVADLWALFRAVGARDLVLTGQVEQPGDLQHYREALGSTPLVVVRLQAGSDGLRERITARGRAGGPALAGDALIGLSADAAQTVLAASLTQQARLERAGVGDVILDTSGETAQAMSQLLATAVDGWFAEHGAENPGAATTSPP